MIIDNNKSWTSPLRELDARVELLSSSTLVETFGKSGALKSFTIERDGEESKFFGFGICQKLKLELLDRQREKTVTSGNELKVYLGASGTLLDNAPTFRVTDVTRDENTNDLSIIAYDALYKATERTVAELELVAPYTIADVANACASLLGLNGVKYINIDIAENALTRTYDEGANFDGTEKVREVLNYIAEATQSIYYLDNTDKLVLKRLDKDGAPDLAITKKEYIELSIKEKCVLASIASVTELGENLEAKLDIDGKVQYIRDNPFIDNREDAAEIVEEAISAVGGLEIVPFICSWRGNFALEIGDKIELTAKDDSTITTFIIKDALDYNGGLSESSSWSYEETAETATNPTTIGEKLKQTFARVDKVNQEIELVAAETAKLKLENEQVTISIEKLQEEVEDITQGEVKEVTTTTGYSFTSEGLIISKSGSEISTTITEDGLTITKDNNEVLTADNKGVKAIDLHATTYLIIGDNSRIEDYADNTRTGCFWIGN